MAIKSIYWAISATFLKVNLKLKKSSLPPSFERIPYFLMASHIWLMHLWKGKIVCGKISKIGWAPQKKWTQHTTFLKHKKVEISQSPFSVLSLKRIWKKNTAQSKLRPFAWEIVWFRLFFFSKNPKKEKCTKRSSSPVQEQNLALQKMCRNLPSFLLPRGLPRDDHPAILC